MRGRPLLAPAPIGRHRSPQATFRLSAGGLLTTSAFVVVHARKPVVQSRRRPKCPATSQGFRSLILCEDLRSDIQAKLLILFGRDSWIRTDDLQYPKRTIVVSGFRTSIPVGSGML